ncbi:MAG TPA: glycosyltransferase family 1 protein [Patescibacteria group bacterium]|nr:glycosyltransferase family 1 protein [Patescibacteria group bacterium]
MIIGIDGNEANVEKRVGISEYAYQLLRQFSELRSQDIAFRIYLKQEPRDDLPKERKGWQYRVIKPGKLWTQWRLPLDLFLNRSKPDVFFSPTHYAPRFSPVPTVVSVMDLSYLYFPELFKKSDLLQLRSWTAYSVKQAKKILTISNSSKDDIIKEYKVSPGNVVVTHLGIKENLSLTPHIYSMNELKAKYGLSDNYLLFVGTLQPRKNIARLIKAFAKICHPEQSEGSSKKKDSSPTAQNDIQLVIVGRRGWLYEEILETPKKLGIEERVTFLENVADTELPYFYKNARCFVLPSLYEGFGLPVLEAMKQGCPVITSNISSLPEAGGEAALYVDPEDVDDIAKKMTQLLSSEKLRKELIEKGKEQVKKFSWEKTARATLAVLEEVAKK